MDEILRLSHISKTFPGVRALDAVDFSLARGLWNVEGVFTPD